MGNVSPGGFDVVVHLSESLINQGLELLPSGSTFPIQERKNVTLTALAVPLPGVGSRDVPLIYDAFVELERPRVVLDQTTNTVKVVCDLSPASQLTFLRPLNVADAVLLTAIVQQIAIAGSVELSCPFVVDNISTVWGGQAVSGRSAIARAAGVAASLTLFVPSADSSGNVLLASAVNGAGAVRLATSVIQSALTASGIVGPNIGDKISDLPLTTPVRLSQGPTPVQTVRDVAARISPPSSPGISLGVLTAIEPLSPGGLIPDAPANLSSLGAVLGISNYWTLHLLCSALRLAHPSMTFTINQSPPSASFSGAVTVDGGETPITIRSMNITVDPNGGLLVDGGATASGGCWDANIDFDFKFTFACDPTNGLVIPAATPPNVNVDVDKDCVCIIIGIVVGAVGGFITGAIIGSLVSPGWGTLIGGIAGAVVGGIGGGLVADFLIDPLDLDGVSLDSLSVLAGLTLPLPVGGAGILIQSCDFDDLVLSGPLVYVDLAERHRSGTVQIRAGSGFDLDAGVIRANLSGVSDDIADLVWSGSALTTMTGATKGSVFWNRSAFDTLSLTDLERFNYSGGTIISFGSVSGFDAITPPRARIIRSIVGDLEMYEFPTEQVDPDWVSFAVRTDEGRYAKCRIHLRNDNLVLEYVVYARPKSCLGTLVTLETLSKTVVESGTEICTEVRNEPVFPNGLPFPFLPVIKPEIDRVTFDDKRSLSFLRKFDLPTNLNVESIALPPKRPRSCGPQITIEHEQVDWQIVDRKQRATIQALPSGLTAPLTYYWTVFGIELPMGRGSEGVGDIVAEYNENSPILTLIADEGEDLIGTVIVHAMDADGRRIRASRQINRPSRKRTGGCCQSNTAKLTAVDAVLLLDRAKTAKRVYEIGAKRLSNLAASGRAGRNKTVGFTEAVKKLGKRK